MVFLELYRHRDMRYMIDLCIIYIIYISYQCIYDDIASHGLDRLRLNLRKDGRGKIAQMRQQTYMLDSLSKMGMQLPMLLKHYKVKYPPDAATVEKLFSQRVPSFKPWQTAVEERTPEA